MLRTAENAADAEEARSARRRLNNVLVYTSLYLPRSFLKLKEYDRAIVSLGIAIAIDPADPELEFQLARCYAGKRDRQRAISHLRSAWGRGLEGKDRLIGDELFAWLRGDPEFDSLLGSDAPRVHGERLMLGFDVSERTVSRLTPRRPADPETRQRWRNFLHNHERNLHPPRSRIATPRSAAILESAASGSDIPYDETIRDPCAPPTRGFPAASTVANRRDHEGST